MRNFFERLGRAATIAGLLSGNPEAHIKSAEAADLSVVMPGEYAKLDDSEREKMAREGLAIVDSFLQSGVAINWDKFSDEKKKTVLPMIFEYFRYVSNATKGSIRNFDVLLDTGVQTRLRSVCDRLAGQDIVVKDYADIVANLKRKNVAEKELFFTTITALMRHKAASVPVAANVENSFVPPDMRVSDGGELSHDRADTDSVVSRPEARPESSSLPKIQETSPEFGKFINRQDAREKKFQDKFFIQGTIREREGRETIALTFDDGPDLTYTPRILDILKQKGIRATFYLQGAYLTQAYQDVIVRILKEGHEIGLHSLDHSQLNKDHGKMAAVYERQVGETEARLRNMTTTPDMPNGYTTSLYRPAYGSIRNDQIEYFAQQGKKIINWSIDTRDWDKNQSGDFMARLVGDGARGGDIVLMHSGGGNRARTVAALPQMLERLQKRNFIFMTTTEITAPVASPKKRSASTN